MDESVYEKFFELLDEIIHNESKSTADEKEQAFMDACNRHDAEGNLDELYSWMTHYFDSLEDSDEE